MGASPNSNLEKPALTQQAGEAALCAFELSPGFDHQPWWEPFKAVQGSSWGPPCSATPSGATQAGAANLSWADPRPIDPSPGLSRLMGRCSTFSVIC